MKSDYKFAIFIFTILFILAGTVLSAFGNGQSNGAMTEPMTSSADSTDIAVFAGGCFWGVEGIFERLSGVKDVVSGYSGGKAETATYQQVGSGRTGHAESVRIVYDPQRITYQELLDVFFLVAHNPTQLNFQGPDRGSQYRSAVFYTNLEQKIQTEEYIISLEEMNTYDSPIVTEVVPFAAFYPAEDYHQDFLVHNPFHPYIRMWDIPKIRHLEQEFPELLKKEITEE